MKAKSKKLVLMCGCSLHIFMNLPLTAMVAGDDDERRAPSLLHPITATLEDITTTIENVNGVLECVNSLENVGRTVIRPVASFVDAITPQQPDVSSDSGPAPVTIKINNLTNLDLNSPRYQIKYGKVIEESAAPATIPANSIREFKTSGRVGWWIFDAWYGPEGNVKYSTSEHGCNVGRGNITFNWDCPIATGSKVTGTAQITNQNVDYRLEKITGSGTYGMSYLNFTLFNKNINN